MIFVTVGTQLPFERLIKAIDEWAAAHPDVPVFAQIGLTEYQPQHMEVVKKLDPVSYQDYFSRAKVVVSHVGMGTIIAGLEAAKALVLMPRLAKLGEHRNDHQLGTAAKFQHFQNITIVNSPDELKSSVDLALSADQNRGAAPLTLSPALSAKLQNFVQSVKNA